jgi:hypothetical protein
MGNAGEEIRSRLEFELTNARLWSALACSEVLRGRKAEGLRAAKKAIELLREAFDAQSGPDHSRTLAMVHAWTGEKDLALAEVTRLAQVPCGIESVHVLKTDPSFAPLRGDRRFEMLIKDPKNNEPLF